MNPRYFTLTTMTRDQKIRERMPSIPLSRDPAGRLAMHECIVYSGLVPISPNTTPRAPMQSAAFADELTPAEEVWDIDRGIALKMGP
jgi:hypothetical protein